MEADEVDQWILRIKDLSETAEGNLDSPNGSEFAVKLPCEATNHKKNGGST